MRAAARARTRTGGLLSAYELSDKAYPGLLHKAQEVGDKLMHAFDSDTGIPYSNINMRTHHVGAPQWTGGASILAEIGSVQVTAVTAGLIHPVTAVTAGLIHRQRL